MVRRPQRPAAHGPRRARGARRACSTSAAPTVPAWDWLRAPTVSTSPSTSTRAGWRRAVCAARRWSCRSRDGPSTWSPPSTSSSTASRRPSPSRRWLGCSRRVAGCWCRCRPTSGPGPTSTRPTTTTAATPGQRAVRAVEAAGLRSCARPTPSPALPVLRRRAARAPRARRRAHGRRARGRRGLPEVPGWIRACSCALSRLDRRLLRAATCRSAPPSSWPPEGRGGSPTLGASWTPRRLSE